MSKILLTLASLFLLNVACASCSDDFPSGEGSCRKMAQLRRLREIHAAGAESLVNVAVEIMEMESQLKIPLSFPHPLDNEDLLIQQPAEFLENLLSRVRLIVELRKTYYQAKETEIELYEREDRARYDKEKRALELEKLKFNIVNEQEEARIKRFMQNLDKQNEKMEKAYQERADRLKREREDNSYSNKGFWASCNVM